MSVLPAMYYIGFKLLSMARAALTFAAPAFNGRIDTHIHALPQVYLDAVTRAGGDPSGFPTPDWSIESTLQSMDQTGASIGTVFLGGGFLFLPSSEFSVPLSPPTLHYTLHHHNALNG